MPYRPRRPRTTQLVAAGVAWAALAPAAAGDALGDIRACRAAATQPLDCIGITVEACAARPDRATTAGVVDCIAAETAAWDVLLNEEYRATMAAMESADATGEVAAPDMTRAGTLRAAQRAWIAFRDAECAAQYARWGRGTMRQIAGANCVLAETGERAVELRDLRGPE